jgi:hypothetical protein
MAFDRPIDADRIDDFNLFSAFVRAPLWILGSVLGGNPSIEKDDHDPVKTRSRLDENIPPGSADYSPSRKRVVSDYDLASSDRKTNSCGNNRKASPDGGFNSYINGPPGLKRSKNLSWSDESGKSLVEYNTQVSYYIALCYLACLGIEIACLGAIRYVGGSKAMFCLFRTESAAGNCFDVSFLFLCLVESSSVVGKGTLLGSYLPFSTMVDASSHPTSFPGCW